MWRKDGFVSTAHDQICRSKRENRSYNVDRICLRKVRGYSRIAVELGIMNPSGKCNVMGNID